MSWTDERTLSLKKLWLEGVSAERIAVELGGTTKNAVIGKVHRMHLPPHYQPMVPRPKIAKAEAPAKISAPKKLKEPKPLLEAQDMPKLPKASHAPQPVLVAPVFIPEEDSSAVSIYEVPCDDLMKSCRWPIGDPATIEFTFCGSSVRKGPYCDTHSKCAYQPPPQRREAIANTMMRGLTRYL